MIKLDDKIRIKVKSDCMQCKHYNHDFTCPAYPNGIPDKLLMNKEKHRSVRPDQTGTLVFESILEEKEPRKIAHRNVIRKYMDEHVWPTEKSNEQFAKDKDKLVREEMERLRKEQNKEK